VRRLGDLVTSAGLEWLVELEPETLLRLPWLKEPLGRLFKDERLRALAQTTGLQLREIPELLLGSHRTPREESTTSLFLRHRTETAVLERKFRERLTSGTERKEFGHQLVGVWGLVGRALRGFVAVGPNVVGYQYGGDRPHGPLKVALLYADGHLKDVPAVSSADVLARVEQVVAGAPIRVFFVGPFEGESRRGAHGMFESATAVALALAPTESASFALRLVLDGDFVDPRASSVLLAAWKDLAESDLGHLLGIGNPRTPAAVRAMDGCVLLETELDAPTLLEGLAAATTDNVRDFLR